MNAHRSPYSKILVVGSPGAGKSTLAEAVAYRLALPYAGINGYRWQTDWKPTPPSRYNRLVDMVLNQAAWVMDDCMQERAAEIWPQADVVIWLDYSLSLVLSRITRRNLGWWMSGKYIWGANQMTLRRAVGGILEATREYGQTRRRIELLFLERDPSRRMRFTEPQQETQWLRLLRAVELT